MTILLLVYLGGVLTILSPCILPVLPFVFARAEHKFATNGLPMIRQTGDVGEHLFTIEFFDVGAEAYSFTFG